MSAPSLKKEATPLLWTGGWDSTFRLLQLLLLERRAVQPYYLIDADRASTGAEIRAMVSIRSHLFDEHPHTKELLHRVEYTEVSDIEPDREITDAFRVVAEKVHIGSQYAWLARFCRQFDLSDVELCIHHGRWPSLVLAPFVRECGNEAHTTFCLDLGRTPREECVLFRYYQFPLLNLRKLDMAATAREHGWTRFMDLTWFCHHPTGGGKPCGICSPCRLTIEEGLGRRIPVSRRVAAGLQQTISRPLKRATRAVARRLTRRSRDTETP
jgi:hypothetical protein